MTRELASNDEAEADSNGQVKVTTHHSERGSGAHRIWQYNLPGLVLADGGQYGPSLGLRRFGILPLVSDRNEEMAKTNRRDILRFGSASLAFPLLAILDVGCTPNEDGTTGSMEPVTDNESTENKKETDTGAAMKIQYLEIVSPDVDAICKTYEQLHGVKFGEPDANLGNARTAKLPSGGLLGVRAPLRDTEEPIVRPYFLVEDIEASVSKAADSGAEIALPPMELPGHGRCAIFIQGGAEHGLWQL